MNLNHLFDDLEWELDEDDTATISLNDVSNFLNKYNFRIGFNV